MGLKLHLGCGKRYIPGFVHVDVVSAPHVDLCSGVDRIAAIGDGACDLIYACHVLEHFHRRDTQRVLREWRRLLAPGGILRLAVPDLEAIARVYLARGKLSEVIGPLYGRQDHLYNIHYTGFDFVTLGAELLLAGFDEVRRWDWRQTEHAEVDDFSRSYIPHMDFESGTLISLNVEATRLGPRS